MANKKQFNKTLLNNVNNKITKLLKNEIIKKKLIVTGKMLKETQSNIVVANPDNGEVIFQVTSTDYFKFVDGNKNIIDDGLNVKGGRVQNKEVINLTEDLYVSYMENILDETLPKGASIIKK